MSKFDLSNQYQKKLALARLEHFLCGSGMIEKLEEEINGRQMDGEIQLSDAQVSAVTRWVLEVVERIDVTSTQEPNLKK